jgi:hypothetical protein
MPYLLTLVHCQHTPLPPLADRVAIQSALALRNVVVPTTSNPQIVLSSGAARVITNPSFELFDNVQIPSWLYVLESNMRGWRTTHPTKADGRPRDRTYHRSPKSRC